MTDEDSREQLIELLLPRGFAARAQSIAIADAACPDLAADIDLLLIRCGADESAVARWLPTVASAVSRSLTSDGLAYVTMPRRLCPAARKCFLRTGLGEGPVFAHVPNWPALRCLVPLDRIAFSYTFGSLTSISSRWSGAVAKAVGVPPVFAAVSALLPSAGMTFRRPNAKPLLNWLFELDDSRFEPNTAVVKTSWRRQSGSVTLHRLRTRGSRVEPCGVAKLNLQRECNQNPAHEAAALRGLGPAAAKAGIRVPEVLAVADAGNRKVLLESPVAGQPAAVRMRGAGLRSLALVAQLTNWLERWNRETVQWAPLTDAWLETEVASCAACLQHELPSQYLAWVLALAARFSNVPVPWVAAHNDLTLWNILLDGAHIGLVDWESAQPLDWPLTDFFYVAADGAAAVSGYRDRVSAARECFTPGGRLAGRMRILYRQIQRGIQAPADFAELCFHACWLRHARNELRAAGGSGPRPFLELARWAATDKSAVAAWLRQT